MTFLVSCGQLYCSLAFISVFGGVLRESVYYGLSARLCGEFGEERDDEKARDAAELLKYFGREAETIDVIGPVVKREMQSTKSYVWKNATVY